MNSLETLPGLVPVFGAVLFVPGIQALQSQWQERRTEQVRFQKILDYPGVEVDTYIHMVILDDVFPPKCRPLAGR